MALDKSLSASSTPMLILKLIEREDMYGYRMIETLRLRSNDVFALKAGTLYPLLHDLKKQGLISSYESVADSGRVRKYYSLTQQGRVSLERREAEWSAFSGAVDRALTLLILALFLAFFVFVFARCLKQRSVLGRLVSLGAAGTLFLQTATYVLWNFGIQILTPMTLPFVSCGNTALICNLGIAGLLFSTFRTDTLFSDTPAAVRKWKRPHITIRWE